jgi:hypothetical protein
MNDIKIPKNVPQILSTWSWIDYMGALKVRSAIGRNKYTVKPGLYRLGNPHAKSEVFVSANYKLSFDVLRKNLKGMEAWILVLDTKGINVWCAAGKGTFGTNELSRQIRINHLENIVSHRRIIVPQLGASGISAHVVKANTGFKVIYGPVRASDIKKFMTNRLKATEAMRTVQFSFKDRLILTPVEISNSLIYLILAVAFFFILSGISSWGFSFSNALDQGITSSIYLLAAYISGAFLTPVLLPWIPFRYFSAKGMIISLILFVILIFNGIGDYTLFQGIGWFFITLGIASFLAMNFTGASTFTSLSGVKKEMKIFVPIQVLASSTGVLIVIISKFW